MPNDSEAYRKSLREESETVTQSRKDEITCYFEIIECQSRINSLNSEIEVLTNSLNDISGCEQVEALEEKIRKLNVEMYNLGLFKGKEKKVLQSKIDEYKAELAKIKPSVDAKKKEINDLIAAKTEEKKEDEKTLNYYNLIGEAFTRKERNKERKKIGYGMS